MNLQGQVTVSACLVILMAWILRGFINKQLNSGQALFWLAALAGGEVLVVFPGLVDTISGLWGNLRPVSWISLLGLLCAFGYMLFQAIKINRLEARFVDLARSIAYMDERYRREFEPATAKPQDVEASDP